MVKLGASKLQVNNPLARNSVVFVRQLTDLLFLPSIYNEKRFAWLLSYLVKAIEERLVCREEHFSPRNQLNVW